MGRPAIYTPEQRLERLRKHNREAGKRRRERERKSGKTAKRSGHWADTLHKHIPSSVLTDLDRRKNVVALTPNQYWLGDPLPGRSALDRR